MGDFWVLAMVGLREGAPLTCLAWQAFPDGDKERRRHHRGKRLSADVGGRGGPLTVPGQKPGRNRSSFKGCRTCTGFPTTSTGATNPAPKVCET